MAGELTTRYRRSRELTHRFLQEAPRLLAIFAFPFGIKAGGTQLVTERRGIGPIKNKALRSEVLLQASIELGDIVALLETGGVDMLGHDGADIVRQVLPRALVGQEPEAVPHVIGQRTIFLHLVELRRCDDRQWIFLAIDDFRLQRRIYFVE